MAVDLLLCFALERNLLEHDERGLLYRSEPVDLTDHELMGF